MSGKLLLFPAGLYMDSRVGQMVQALHIEFGSKVLCLHTGVEETQDSFPVTVFRRPYIKRYLWLRKMIKEEHIKLIWVYNIPVLPHAIVGSLFTGAKIVMNFAGEDIQASTELGYGFRRSLFRRVAFRVLMCFPSRFVCMSPVTREMAVESGINERKLVTIPNMFHIDRDFPLSTEMEVAALRRELGIEQEEVVLCVARHSAIKRVDQVIRAFRDVKARHPNTVLVLLGPDGGLLAQHQTLASSLGIRDCVRFIELAPRQRVRVFCALASVSCNVSDVDAFCNPVIEAMTQGTPVVVGPNIGAGRYISDQPFCRVVSPASVNSITEGICGLLTERAKEQYGAAAKAKAKEFDVTRVFPVWKSFFSELLA